MRRTIQIGEKDVALDGCRLPSSQPGEKKFLFLSIHVHSTRSQLSFTLLGSHALNLNPLPWREFTVTVIDKSTLITRLWDQQFSKEMGDIYCSLICLLSGRLLSFVGQAQF